MRQSNRVEQRDEDIDAFELTTGQSKGGEHDCKPVEEGEKKKEQSQG